VRELDDLVEALATQLARPVAIDDLQYRLAAYSSHGDSDPVRTQAILHRRVNSEAAKRWVAALNLPNVTGCLRTPAVPSLEMKPRVCAPVRCQGLLLGYLWVIDDGEAMTQADLDLTARYAAEAGTLVYRERLLEDRGREREHELTDRLLGPGPAQRAEAAATLVAEGLFTATSRIGVLRLLPLTAADATARDELAVVLASAVSRLRRSLGPREAIGRPGAEDAAVVVALNGDATAELRRISALALACGRAALDESGARSLVIGVGSPVAALEQAAQADRQAGRAAQFARRRGMADRIVWWDLMGAYRMVTTAIEAVEEPRSLVAPELLALLEDPDAALLVETLERYLDLAGDAAATAAELFVHRTTLYQRLKRVERITGMSLRRGDDRLTLLLGLRVLRLTGGADALPAQPASAHPTGALDA
jgi:PucR C-terminal helix-turn-helix domain